MNIEFQSECKLDGERSKSYHEFQEFMKQVGVFFFHVKFALSTYSMQVGLNQSIMQGLHIIPGKNECTIDRANDKSKDYLQSCQEMKRGCKTFHIFSFNLAFFFISSSKNYMP